MGQYHVVVNLDKKEYLYAHELATGLKLVEQMESLVSAALIVLLAASNGRGGGDFEPDSGTEKIIGRWAGDRIAIVGDYAEPEDLPLKYRAELIYRRTIGGSRPTYGWVNISELVLPVLERELRISVERTDGWRHITDGRR